MKEIWKKRDFEGYNEDVVYRVRDNEDVLKLWLVRKNDDVMLEFTFRKDVIYNKSHKTMTKKEIEKFKLKLTEGEL